MCLSCPSTSVCRRSTICVWRRRSLTGRLRSPGCCWRESAAHMWVQGIPSGPLTGLLVTVTRRPWTQQWCHGAEQHEWLFLRNMSQIQKSRGNGRMFGVLGITSSVPVVHGPTMDVTEAIQPHISPKHYCLETTIYRKSNLTNRR